MELYDKTRDICSQLCSLFYSLSFELILLDLDAAILEYFEDDSSFQNPDGCEKLPLDPCVYEKECDLLTFHYLSASKVNKIQSDIHDLYLYAEDLSNICDEYIEKFKVCSENLVQVTQQLQTTKEEFRAYKKYIEERMNSLLEFEKIKKEKKLSRVESINIKEQIIDFLYKIKDKFPFSSTDNNSSLNECNTDNKRSMDVFDKVIEFMIQNKFKPSKKLIKEYSESKLNKALGLPPFELVNKYTGIKREVYEELKKRCRVC